MPSKSLLCSQKNMFGIKNKYSDNELGELTFSGDLWNSELITSFGEIFISVNGDKKTPNNVSLNQAKQILTNITKHIKDAQNFVKTNNISIFSENYENMELEGFYSRSENGEFDLDFGLSNDKDSSITVHFINSQPYEISLSH